MMDSCKTILPLFISALFTAGHVLDGRYNLGWASRHDGSISGIILLSSVLVVSFVSIFGTTLFDKDNNGSESYATASTKYIYLCVVSIFVIISFLLLEMIRRKRQNVVSRHDPNDHTAKVKLLFLWFFTLGTVFFSVTKIIKIVSCEHWQFDVLQKTGCINSTIRYTADHGIARVFHQTTKILFCIIQSIFIQVFSSYRFNNSLLVYYCLLVIVLANVSQWTYNFASAFQYIPMKVYEDISIYCPLINATKPMDLNFECYSKEIFNAIKPYFHPVDTEYSLFCLVFISNLWPRSGENVDDYHLSFEIDIQNELSPLIASNEPIPPRKRRSCLKFKTILVGFLGVMLAVPNYALSYLSFRETNNVSTSFNIAVSSYEVFLYLCLIVLLTICFYMLSSPTYFTPLMVNQRYHFHHKLLVTSFLGALAYITLEVLSCIGLKYETDDGIINIVLIARLLLALQVYIQVVFILQLNSYTRSNSPESKSLNYLFLVLAIINLVLWIGDSLFEVLSYEKKIMKLVFDDIGEKIISSFLFPFFIFFRFKSFIIFYGIYEQQLTGN